jgi:hypothetical protein
MKSDNVDSITKALREALTAYGALELGSSKRVNGRTAIVRCSCGAVTAATARRDSQARTAMNIDDVLQKLYDSEINVSIESDWDNGFTVGIGNQRNGFVAKEHS